MFVHPPGASQQHPDTAALVGPNTDASPARILIVDDERQNRKLLEVMLAPEGYFLETAASGEEALAMIAQKAPDLVLLDVMLPGMNGYQVAGRIKGALATKNIPVILVTALDDRNERLRGLDAGAEDCLGKPVDRAELCVRVRNLLRLGTYGRHRDKPQTLRICAACGRCYGEPVAACPEDGAPLHSPHLLPHVLLGRYRFLRILGEGGMGVVFSAHDERLGRDVAVKMVRPEHFIDAALKERFEREAGAVARIQHPGVIAIHDSGELHDGTAFIVMEKLAGCDLKLLMRSHGRGTPAQVARLVRQGCSALGAAHRAGIIHRDVKPANVFLVDDPTGFRVKLLDFGIAKSMAFDSGLTIKGTVLGTPRYMAPEHVRGDAVDGRADLYSFAAVAYEALTGRQAVPGDDPSGVILRVLQTVPPPISSVLSTMPPEIDAAFASALAKNRADRPSDVESWGSSFADLLETVAADSATGGWPSALNALTELRDSQLDRDPTFQLPRARRN